MRTVACAQIWEKQTILDIVKSAAPVRSASHANADRALGKRRRFNVVLIKPSHYHDDGYVIRWWRGLVPSNSLAVLHGIALDCAERPRETPS